MATPAYAPMNGDPFEAEGLTLRDYLAVVWRRKWIIVLVVIVATGAAYFFAARQPDMYAASTDLIYETHIDVSNPLSKYGYTDPYERELEMRAIGNILPSPDMIAARRGDPRRRRTPASSSRTTSTPAPRGRRSGTRAQNGGDAANASAAASDIPGYSVTLGRPRDGRATAPSARTSSAITGTSTDRGSRGRRRERLRRGLRRLARGAADASRSTRRSASSRTQMSRYQDAAKQSADYLILQQRLRDLQILRGTATGNYRVLRAGAASPAPRSSRVRCAAPSSASASACSPASASPSCSSSSTPACVVRTRSRASCASRSSAASRASPSASSARAPWSRCATPRAMPPRPSA